MDRLKCLMFVTALSILFPSVGSSFVTGTCVNCHTMHNSDNNAPVVPDSQGVQPGLLNDTCIGCHTASTGIVNNGTKPYVMQMTANYGVNTLAGGDFYWVSLDPIEPETKGHNVDALAPLGTRTAPGGVSFDVLTCAGINGCHGDRAVLNEISAMGKTHHDISGSIDGVTPATSFRFLAGVMGLEDPDWELINNSSKHNQYAGEARTTDDPAAMTISQFCAQCHGLFHDGAGNDGIADGAFGTDPWIRHPTDVDMFGLGGEFTNQTYSNIAPVASVDVSSVKSQILDVSGDAIVMCLSCHRAHGSPYYASLRWDYRSWPAGGTDGCSICHTAKN